MPLAIRRFEPQDQDRVWWLLSAANEAIGLFEEDGPHNDDLRDIPGHYFDGGEFLVVEQDGQVVAMGALTKTGEAEAELKRMRVDPSMHRQGIGRQLLQALEDRARELGYTSLYLGTTVQQTAAQALYESFGYRIRSREIVRGFEAMTYEKQLS